MTLAAALLVAVTALAVGPGRVQAQTPTPTPTSSAGIRTEPAPIEELTVAQVSGQWVATVKSGLPSGCAAFQSITAQQNGTVFNLTVLNAMNVPPGGACTMIYGTTTHSVNLTGTIQRGDTYRVVANGGSAQSRETTFTAGTSGTSGTAGGATDTGPGRTCDDCPPNTSTGPMPAQTGNAGLLENASTGLVVFLLAFAAVAAVASSRVLIRR